jgi:hypothetical protein
MVFRQFLKQRIVDNQQLTLFSGDGFRRAGWWSINDIGLVVNQGHLAIGSAGPQSRN